MDYYLDEVNNLIKILTCSDDKTVIYWNIPINELLDNNNDININRYSYKHIFYSNYINHIFYLGDTINYINLKLKSDEFLQNSYYKKKDEKDINNNDDNDEYNLTCVKFSPDGNYLVLGDTFGNILIYSLLNYNFINKIEAHNGEINSIDMIYYPKMDKLYLSSGSSDNFVSLIDFTSGWNINPLNDEKTLMEKMSSPVISVVFCVDKYQNLKLIVGEQNSTITFFQINNGLLYTLQKNYDKNLKTYCLNYSVPIKKIISGHNGKISIWKTSKNIAHKHFQVNRGDKLIDNFRIASDNKGLIFATSNEDKFIRVRALHDGKLLAKIQISESISDLFFILDDNYLIASSIEGYLYFFKLNKDFINELKLDNELKNSTEERNIIKNKLLLLQKFMESDTSLSKNNQVKNLIYKFQQSEEASLEDLKILDGFVKEGKKSSNLKEEKIAENIKLTEEKAIDNDEQENENNKNDILNKSNIFEKGLRDRISTDNVFGNKNKKNIIGRISLTDNYNSKNNLHFNNNKDINLIDNKVNNEIKEEININNKFSNININKEFENNNNIINSNYSKNKVEDNINKEEIKEEIDENNNKSITNSNINSNYNPNIINNSNYQLSQTHLNNLIITQTSYAVK